MSSVIDALPLNTRSKSADCKIIYRMSDVNKSERKHKGFSPRTISIENSFLMLINIAEKRILF